VSSVYVPVAVNCWVVPFGIDWLIGVTVTETSAAGVTLREVVPLTDPDVAIIVADPTAAPLARPVAFTVATPVLEDVQLTEDVRSLVLPSVNVPVALNCSVVPRAIAGLAGLTARDASLGGDTVSAAVPIVEFMVAVMVAVPSATLVARPLLPVTLLSVATAVEEDDQATVVVRSFVAPSL
jgi:hypothetical protein